MKNILPLIAVTLLAFSSCRVEFSPNAPWRDVPSVYCVLDPEEDTVWVRLQRCYLGEDNLYNYSNCHLLLTIQSKNSCLTALLSFFVKGNVVPSIRMTLVFVTSRIY